MSDWKTALENAAKEFAMPDPERFHPEHVIPPIENYDIKNLILTAKAKDSPFVKQAYTAARKDFISFIKAYNSKLLPKWAYGDDQRALVANLRQKWTEFSDVFPSLGFETGPDGSPDPIALVHKLIEIGEAFDLRLSSSDVWMKYSRSAQSLMAKMQDYCFDNLYFSMRKAGQLQFPGELPREQQQMSSYSESFDPTSPFFGIHQGFHN